MKRRKIFVTILLGLFLIGIVTSATIGVLKSVPTDKEDKDILDAINNEPIMRSDIVCGERLCSQKMWKGDYNLGKVSVDKWKCKEYENVTDEFNQTEEICILEDLIKEKDIIKDLTKQQEKQLKEIAKVIKKRNEKENDTIIADYGEVTIK